MVPLVVWWLPNGSGVVRRLPGWEVCVPGGRGQPMEMRVAGALDRWPLVDSKRLSGAQRCAVGQTVEVRPRSC